MTFVSGYDIRVIAERDGSGRGGGPARPEALATIHFPRPRPLSPPLLARAVHTTKNVTDTTRNRHNPERRAFRGRSYRRGGRRVRDLRAELVRE